MAKFENVKYGLIPSCNDKLREVAVSYTANGHSNRYYIFIRENGKWKDKDYLKEAKVRFKADCKAGKVKPTKAIKIKHISPVGKRSGLVFATSFLAITTLALGGLFTWKLLTGGNGGGGGGGGGLQPGPVVWKSATKKEASNTRDNVLGYQLTKNPFDILGNAVNASQFSVTMETDGGKVNETEKTTYQIDTQAFYIKKKGRGLKNDIDQEATYYTYYGNASLGYNFGLYSCRYEGSPGNYMVYPAETKEEALRMFTPSYYNPEVKTITNELLVNELYGYDISCEGIMLENMYISELGRYGIQDDDIKMKYEKGNDLSFKVSHSGSYTTEKGATIESELNMDIENAILKKVFFSIKDNGTIAQKITVETKADSFALDDLTPYFPQQ